jgi:hypothetical protein
MLSLSRSDYGSNADDKMIDVLGKLVAEGFSDFGVTFPDESVGGREPGQVGHGLQIPDDDTLGHAILLEAPKGRLAHNGFFKFAPVIPRKG